VRKSRFTLIELLVVIAIIAILAGMLLPSLSQVKETAKSTQCVSNMKQVALSFFHYTSDFNNILPPYWNDIIKQDDGKLKGTTTGGRYRMWYSAQKGYDLLASYIHVETSELVALAGWATKKNQGPVFTHSLACPSRLVKLSPTSKNYLYSGIGMSEQVTWGGTKAKNPPKPITRVKWPTRSMLTMEKTVATDHYIKSNSTSDDKLRMVFPHRGKTLSSVTFLDFHVEQMKKGKVPDGAISDTAANTCFWNPFSTDPAAGQW